jgi:ribonuclease R
MTFEKIETEQILAVLRGFRQAVVTPKAILARFTSRGRRFKGARKVVLGMLRQLVAAGQIEQVVGGYRLARRDGLREGVIESTSDPLHGTVVDDGRRAWAVQSATPIEPGQRILFAPLDGSDDQACALEKVGEAPREWVGVLRAMRGESYVVPFKDRARWRVSVARRDLSGAEIGEVVVVIPLSSGRSAGRGKPTALRGRVAERLGRPGDPEADFRAVAWNHKLRLAFPAQVEAEVEAISEALDPAELSRRVDLRDRPFLTIDPASARDHDDALCLEQEGEQLRLWVAIADVSHYVTPGSALDREALLRGNSVYFPDRVVPMLPERISGDLCSLRAASDRFVLVVEMCVGNDGRVLRSGVYPSVIRSRAGLSYEQAASLMAREPGDVEPAEREIAEQVRLLARLETRLSRRRFERGSIDFALSESQIELDATGRPVAIVRRDRTQAHRAVEEAMLLANRVVSQCLSKAGIACVYRIHEAPEVGDLADLQKQLQGFGLLAADTPRRLESKQINLALRKASGRPEERLVNMIAVRSMKQARYAPDNHGHYALGFSSYLHFTSPIRRYADLVVHRSLMHWLELGTPSPLAGAARFVDARDSLQLAAVAKRISYRERIAVQAERDMVDLKKCAFMSQFIGETFAGIISGTTAHGLYVTLDEHDVDGLMPSASLGFDLELNQSQSALIARRGGARYQLGDAIRVQVEEVNLLRGWIRFAPDCDPPAGERRPGRKPRGKGSERKRSAVKRGRRPGPKARR